jgi:hypothetical protein
LNGKRWLQLQDTEEEFGDAKGVINIRKLKTNRQHNGQQKMDKQPSTKYTYKAKDLVTRTPLKTESKRKCSGRVSSICSIFSFLCGVFSTNHCLYLSNIQDGRQDIRRSCNMNIFREYVTKKNDGHFIKKI